MNIPDLSVFEENGNYIIRVCGRANFDTGVPLRELVKNLNEDFSCITFEMAECTAVDSTFMGVMTMLALEAKSHGKCAIINGVTPQVRNLLRGLGVDKLFEFRDAPEEVKGRALCGKCTPGSNLDRAQTVVDAHKTLVIADSDNLDKFAGVIDYAQQDLDALRAKEAAGKNKKTGDQPEQD